MSENLSDSMIFAIMDPSSWFLSQTLWDPISTGPNSIATDHRSIITLSRFHERSSGIIDPAVGSMSTSDSMLGSFLD